MQIKNVLACFLILVILVAENAHSETGNISLEEYLTTLGQINQAARVGAEVYLRVYQNRCGHPMGVGELRRAITDGNGDPVLMGIIHAAYHKDASTLRAMSTQISCGR